MGSASSDSKGLGRLGEYLLVRRIAVGGMAEVFEARRADVEGDDERFVIKVPLPQYSNDDDYAKALAHEAALHASLTHPNVVRVLNWCVNDDRTYLVMEFVDGCTLDELNVHLRRTGRRMPVDVALSIVADVLRALDYIHKATDDDDVPLQIVHRDVTPQNILVSKHGTVRLSDLGIARSALREARTRTGVIKGKVRYLSPEQATCSSLDHRTDLYAVGLLLFELLTGESFVQGDTDIELLRAAEAPPFRAPSSIVDLDRRLDRIVERALERFPEERYPEAAAFLSAVEEILDDADGDGESPSLSLLIEEVLELKTDKKEEVPLVAFDGDLERGQASSSTRPMDVESDPKVTQRRSALPLLLIGATIVGGGIAAWFWLGSGDGGVQRAMLSDAGIVHRSDDVQLESRTASDLDAALSSFDEPVVVPAGETSVAQLERDSGVSKSPPAIVVGKSRPTVVTAQADDASAGTQKLQDVGSTSEASARRVALKARLSALRSGLGQRGILVEDLPASEREAVTTAQRQLSGFDDSALDHAGQTISQLESALPGLQVDAEFVRRKLDRVGAQIRRAKNRGVDTSRLEELVSMALQEFADGRYDATNRRLNEMIRLLRRAER